MRPDTPRFDTQQPRQGSVRIGIGLLLIESWLFAVVAFAALPRHQGFWLSYLPYALLIPPVGLMYLHVARRSHQFVATFAIYLSASSVGMVLRPWLTAWLEHTMRGL